MKKMILGFAVVIAMVASVAAFASSNSNHDLNCDESHNSVSITGKGACRHAGCKCQWYSSAGTGGKCVCGHWDYVHN